MISLGAIIAPSLLSNSLLVYGVYTVTKDMTFNDLKRNVCIVANVVNDIVMN